MAARATAGGIVWIKPRVEGHGNDVVAAETRPGPAIGGRHLVRHVLAREVGQRLHGRKLHLHVDRRGAHVEGAAEDVGEAEDVVDLVRIIRTPGRHDRVLAHRVSLLGRDLGVGVGHGEDDGLRRHALHHLGAERALGREAEEDVRPRDRLGQRALRGRRGMGRLPLVHAGFPALVHDAFGVAEKNVLGLGTP